MQLEVAHRRARSFVRHHARMPNRAHEAVVRRSFENQVSLFSGPDSPFAKRPESSLAWIEPLTPEMLVLDVACGAAHASEPIAPLVRQIVGVDVTPALLALGAARLRDADVRNVLLQEANAEALPFVDESFDLVFCRSSLHHFDDPRQAVAEMVRVCAPEGRVVLFDLVAPDADRRERFDHVHRLLDPSHVRTFLEAELVELMPGGVDTLSYGETFTIRLPIELVCTDQSDRDEIVRLLQAELRGDAPPTGFEPVEEDGAIVVSFTTCVVHAERSDPG